MILEVMASELFLYHKSLGIEKNEKALGETRRKGGIFMAFSSLVQSSPVSSSPSTMPGFVWIGQEDG